MPFFSSLVIINKITLFSRFKLHFDLYACLIVFSPLGTYKTFNATDLLFNSNFFQSATCDGKFSSFQSYLSIKGLTFGTLSG